MKINKIIKQHLIKLKNDKDKSFTDRFMNDIDNEYQRNIITDSIYKIIEYKENWNGKIIKSTNGYKNYITRLEHINDKFSLTEQVLYDIKYEIEHNYNKIIVDPIRNTKYGIENFIFFMKPIWKFRTWDSGYIEEVLLLMLKKFDKDWDGMDFFVGQEDVIKTIKKMILLLERIIKSDDYDDDVDVHQIKNGAESDDCNVDYKSDIDVDYKELFNLLGDNLRKLWW